MTRSTTRYSRRCEVHGRFHGLWCLTDTAAAAVVVVAAAVIEADITIITVTITVTTADKDSNTAETTNDDLTTAWVVEGVVARHNLGFSRSSLSRCIMENIIYV